MARFDDLEERERYMDGLERQMELQRQHMQHTLNQTIMSSNRRRESLEKLWSYLPSLPGRTTVRSAVKRGTSTKSMQSEAPSAHEKSSRERSEPGSRWRRVFGGF